MGLGAALDMIASVPGGDATKCKGAVPECGAAPGRRYGGRRIQTVMRARGSKHPERHLTVRCY